MTQTIGPPMPHNGQLLQQTIEASRHTKTQMARLLDVTPSGVQEYLKQPTLHAALLWKAGQVLQENFFATLATAFPIAVSTAQELQLQEQVVQLQEEVATLKNEIETYKKILAYIKPGG